MANPRQPLSLDSRYAKNLESLNKQETEAAHRSAPIKTEDLSGESTGYNWKGTGISKPQKGQRFFIAKLGPIVGISIFTIAILIGGLTMLSPSIQIQHITELLAERYDMGGYTSLHRTDKVLAKKLACQAGSDGGMRADPSCLPPAPRLTPSGKLDPYLPFYYKKMTGETISKYNEAGFTLIDTGGNVVTSSVSPGDTVLLKRTGSYKTWNPWEFQAAYYDQPEFRTDVNKVYKGRAHNWYDARAAGFLSKAMLWQNRKGTLAGNGVGVEEATRQNEQQSGLDYLVNVDDSELEDLLNNPSTGNAEEVARNSLLQLNTVDWPNKLCNLISIFGEFQEALRTEQARQLATSAVLFMSDGNKVKQGEQIQEVVASIGDRLNTPYAYQLPDPEKLIALSNGGFDLGQMVNAIYQNATNDDGYLLSQPKVATESQGYKWLQFYEPIDALDPSSSRFVTGSSGMFGSLIDFVNSSGLNFFCGPFVPAFRITSAIVAIFAIFSPDMSLQDGVKPPLLQMANSILDSLLYLNSSYLMSSLEPIYRFAQEKIAPYAISLLAPMLLRMGFKHLSLLLSGYTCGDAMGQDFGNCIIAGAGAAHSRNASWHGNATLTESAAYASFQDRQHYLELVAEEERLERSPFDITSKYTFAGNIASKLLSKYGQSTSLVGVFTTVGSIVRDAASSILPSTSAATFSFANFSSTMSVCTDTIHKGSGSGPRLATDPWCNTIHGVPSDHLFYDDPDALIEKFFDEHQLEVTPDGNIRLYYNYYDKLKITPDGFIYCDYNNHTYPSDPDHDLEGNVIGTCTGAKTPLTYYREYCMGRGYNWPVDTNENVDKRYCVIGDGYFPSQWPPLIPCDGINDRDYRYGATDSICGDYIGGHLNCPPSAPLCLAYYNDDYRSQMALFYLDTAIETNLNRHGMSGWNNGYNDAASWLDIYGSGQDVWL